MLVTGLSGCWGSSDDEAFCAQLRVSQDAGPLFPPRTDGEPVPNRAALEALIELGRVAPAEIREDVQVLVDEAEALVADAESRQKGAQLSPQTSRWSRSVVVSAQRAVFRYSVASCDIDLTRTPNPDAEMPQPESRPD